MTTSEKDIAASAMQKLDAWIETLPAGEQAVIGDLLRSAISGTAGEGGDVSGFTTLSSSFVNGITLRTPPINSLIGDEEARLLAMLRKGTPEPPVL